MPRVLFCDDEILIRRVAPRLLKGTDYVATVAASAEEALTTFQTQGRFDVVVTDLWLASGGMTGEELVQKLRGLQPSLPVVVMSGDFDEVEEVVERLGSGALGLSKPFDKLELIAVLEFALGKPRAAERL